MSQIPYLQKYLIRESHGYLVRIQVISNIQIFEWIIAYAEYQFSKDRGQPLSKPSMSIKQLSSILNSAEYLGMNHLVTKCVKFIPKNIQEIS